jgi:HEPN domain-containing protein
MSGDNIDVNKWIQYAMADYTAALNMVRLHKPIPIEIVCYHCQQAAEKLLKAYIIAKNDTLVKTHDLVVLLSQCRQYSTDFDSHAKSCMALTTFASHSRYPSNIEITEQQMRQAVKDVEGIISFMTPLLKEMGYTISSQKKQKSI